MEEEGVNNQFSCSSSENQFPMLMPSRVGREFVRQYYRLLQKAPELLHRFYTNDSTCTHGDFEMALGKRDIQSLFLRENYIDCCTNIMHVDIHGTLVSGVVVLVTGEQSNAGFPMRPFVQSFVLAELGPRRYYVCNDIFRYTDNFVKMRSVVDVECQTTKEHIGDGDQKHHYEQLQIQQQEQQHQQHQQQQEQQHQEHQIQPDQKRQQPQQQPQQQTLQQPQHQHQHQHQEHQQELDELSSENDAYSELPIDRVITSNIETSSGRLHIPENCAIPMPRWANTHQHKDIKSNSYLQQNQLDQISYSCSDKNEENNDTTSSSTSASNAAANTNIITTSYLKQSQIEEECPFYRSMIAQALTPGMEFEEISPMSSSSYDDATYYSEDILRVSIGVSSGCPVKCCSELGLQSQQPMSSRDSKDNVAYTFEHTDDSKSQSNESQEKMPTYAKLLMSAFTRASLKNNQAQKTTLNSSSIASPLRATVMHSYTTDSNSSNGNMDNMTDSQSSTSPTTNISDHHDHSFSASATAHNFFPIQRNNYTQGMRRNDRRRASSAQKYDDNQQLFLGQIPHNATEEELVNIFSYFGNVLELRILPNLGGKIQPGAKHPLKYGFLTFEHVESVKACLESRPVFFPNNSPDGQKLNVRAKKPSVARDEVQQTCQSLDGQSMGNDWLKASTRRNSSVGGHNIVGNNSGNNNNSNLIFNRKDNRHSRGASLDSGTQIQGSKKFAQSTGANGPGSCGRR